MTDVLEGQKTDTSSCYEGVLKKVKTALAKKLRGKLHIQTFFTISMPECILRSLIELCFANFDGKTLAHPLYSHEIAPSNFFIFSKLKGTQFHSLNEAKTQVTACYQRQPQQFYRDRNYQCKRKLQKCIDNNGAYVEK